MIRELLTGLVGERVERVSEIVGRVAFGASAFWKTRTARSVDATQTDYEFWDHLRRGQTPGYQFGGLFAQPIAEIITSYMLGKGLGARLTDSKGDESPDSPRGYTNTLLARFLGRIHGLLLTLIEDDLSLGDQYVIVNPDSSLSVPSPDMVEMIYDETDYRKVIRCVVTTKLDAATITDEYRLDGRTVTLHFADSRADVVQRYENLIGRLPVVHFPNDRSSNETHGRSYCEPLLPAFARYDDVTAKLLSGAEMMGNPVPSIEGLEDLRQVEVANETSEDETYTDKAGNEETRKVLKMDRDPMFLIGKGGKLEFKSPAVGFTKDNRDALKSLFLLILDKTRIPEFLWGGAIASSKASAETQYPPFVQFIEGRRAKLAGLAADDLLGAEAQGGLFELIDIWLRMRRLVDPKVVVGPVALDWPELSEVDEQLRLEWVKFLSERNALPDEQAVALSDLVDDPAAAVEAARAEAKEKQKEFDDLTQRRIDLEAERTGGDERASRPGERGERAA